MNHMCEFKEGTLSIIIFTCFVFIYPKLMCGYFQYCSVMLQGPNISVTMTYRSLYIVPYTYVHVYNYYLSVYEDYHFQLLPVIRT